MHSVVVDEEFSMVASHVGEAIKKKIVDSDYVDFVKLLPRDDLGMEIEGETDQYIMINKGGHAFWTPESEVNSTRRSNLAISSFSKWEQAFQIFSHIYVSAHPNRASELMQYSYIIHDASQSLPWENVYGYDIVFRRHMSKFPNQNWGIILQQAWAFKMHDRVSSNFERGHNNNRNRGANSGCNRDVCWKFNSGKCMYGLSCKFEHKCAFCLNLAMELITAEKPLGPLTNYLPMRTNPEEEIPTEEIISTGIGTTDSITQGKKEKVLTNLYVTGAQNQSR